MCEFRELLLPFDGKNCPLFPLRCQINFCLLRRLWDLAWQIVASLATVTETSKVRWTKDRQRHPMSPCCSVGKGTHCNSFVYTSGHCRSRMEVKIVAGSLFVHCKIAYFYSVTAEKCLIVSLPNFVTMRKILLSISCKIFSWIRTTKLKIHAMKLCDLIKDFKWFICTL